jgi:hypothetical protein
LFSSISHSLSFLFSPSVPQCPSFHIYFSFFFVFFTYLASYTTLLSLSLSLSFLPSLLPFSHLSHSTH